YRPPLLFAATVENVKVATRASCVTTAVSFLIRSIDSSSKVFDKLRFVEGSNAAHQRLSDKLKFVGHHRHILFAEWKIVPDLLVRLRSTPGYEIVATNQGSAGSNTWERRHPACCRVGSCFANEETT